MMSQVGPIDSKPTMIKRMNHFMDHCIFHVFLVKEPVLTEQDTVIGGEPA